MQTSRLEENRTALLGAIATFAEFTAIRHHLTTDATAIEIAVDTTAFERHPDGLKVNATERLWLLVDAKFPNSMGIAYVDHERWHRFPHVILGQKLCLYLDPINEWHPAAGAAGLLDRVHDWLTKAIAGEFDAATALYHPVGGVPYTTEGAPTLVVRTAIPLNTGGGIQIQRMLFRQRSTDRVDVAAWQRQSDLTGAEVGVLVVLTDMIPFRKLSKLSSIAFEIGQQSSGKDRKNFIKKLTQAAATHGQQHPLRVVLAVPNPATPGEAGLHLLAAAIAADDVAASIDAARRLKLADPAPDPHEPDLAWLHVDDTRSSLHTRRDADRPMTAFAGKTIDLWGCGALGSWIAEALVRSGVARLRVSDPGRVTTGLLVRQNYTEADIGRPKAHALADRLRAISDSTIIEATAGWAATNVDDDCDLLIDATVNTFVAEALQALQTANSIQCTVVQIATDSNSSSLGILTIRAPDATATTDDVDRSLQQLCEHEPALQPFLTLWDHQDRPPIIPTPGCSTPTFRGSVADACAIATTALNLLALPFSRGGTGGFVFGLHQSTEAPGVTRSVHLA